jgi:hypothetical protein
MYFPACTTFSTRSELVRQQGIEAQTDAPPAPQASIGATTPKHSAFNRPTLGYNKIFRQVNRGKSMRLFNLIIPLKPESDRMLTFDVLRFIAASGVVIHHSNSFLFPAALRLEMKEPSFGLALLVDLFFLISGYVIAVVYGEKIRCLPDYFEFLQKRVARLWPLHLVTLIVFAALYFAASAAGMKVGTQPDLSATCFAKTALMLHAIFPCNGSSVNPVSWSISTEMAMYAIFPLLYWILARSAWAAVAGIIVASVCLGIMSWSLSAHEWTQSVPYWRALPSFCFGICLCRIMSQSSGPTAQSYKLALFLLLAMTILMFYFMSWGGGKCSYRKYLCSLRNRCIYRPQYSLNSNIAISGRHGPFDLLYIYDSSFTGDYFCQRSR